MVKKYELSKANIMMSIAFMIPVSAGSESINAKKLKKIRLKTYLAGGLIWKGVSTQNTNWNKLCETPDGKIWVLSKII